MTCPICGAAGVEGARFCSQCGHALGGGPERACAVCGAALPADARFCVSCGSPVAEAGGAEGAGAGGAATRISALQRLMPKQYVDRLLAARGRLSGERRVITILFFDVKGSTAMAERLDPEDVMEIMNEAFGALLEPVYRREGTLARIMGDGILCFFGAPIAHEDDPARACSCALEVLEAARRYAAQLERTRGIAGFDVRVGVNTGLVVVGEVGADLRVEYTAMGDAVNLAARMESAARPGTVLVTENTYRLTSSRFEFEALGRLEVKGRSDPVTVYRLLGEAGEASGSQRARRRGLEGLRSDLVGREREMGEIEKALQGLAEGRGGRIAIVGDAGVGKSRLVREARRLAPPGVCWSEGRCPPHAESMSYLLARDLLARLLGVARGAAPGAVAAALRRGVDACLAPTPGADAEAARGSGRLGAREISAHLACLLEIPLDAEFAQRVARLPAEEMRARLARAYGEFVGARARLAPLAVVLEDLHWVDPSSLKLIECFLPLTRQVPLLLLLVFRQDDGAMRELRHRLESDEDLSCRLLPLAPLGQAESERLLANLLRARDLPEDAGRLILARAEGNAFYLEEVLRSLLDDGVLELRPGGAALVRPLGAVQVPETLQGVIMARLDRLAPEDKRVLQTAAVLGRSFRQGVLARVLGPQRGGRPLAQCLEELKRREFILLRGGAGEPSGESPGDSSGDGEYVFKHALTLEVAYASLLRAERRELHRRAGEALEALFPELAEQMAPVLADHFEKGQVEDKAFDYLVRSAAAAARVCAHQEARDYYQRAVELAAPGVARAHEGLGDVHLRTAEYESAMAAYGSALSLVDDARGRAALHRKRGQVCEKSGRFDEARACFETGLAEMRGGGDAAETARLYVGLGLVYYHKDRLEQAVMVSLMALETMERLGERAGIAQACNTLGVAHGKLGDWESAIRYHAQGLAVWDDLGDAYGQAAAHNNLGLAHRQRGDLQGALEHFRRSVELFEKLGNRHGLARAYDNLSHVHLERGDSESSRDCLEKAVTLLAEISVDGGEVRSELWRSGVW